MDMNAPHPSPNFSSQLQQKPTGRRSRLDIKYEIKMSSLNFFYQFSFDAGPSQMPMGMPPNQPPTVLNPNVMAPMMAQQPPMGSAPWSSVNPSQQQPLGFPPQMSAVPFQSGPQPSAFPPPGIFNPQMAGPRAPLLTSPPHNLQQPLMNVNVQQKIPEDPTLKPNLAYYDLPAGLMAPLVKLTDCDYEPLNPTAIRLPPPMPPSERLIGAVEAFYSPPNHENPRDA